MKRIVFLGILLIAAGCTDGNMADEAKGGDDDMIITRLGEVDINSFGSSSAEARSLAGEDPDPTVIDATHMLVARLDVGELSNLAEVDIFEKMHTDDRSAIMNSLGGTAASVAQTAKMIAEDNVEASDVGSRNQDLVSAIEGSVSNIAAQRDANWRSGLQ